MQSKGEISICRGLLGIFLGIYYLIKLIIILNSYSYNYTWCPEEDSNLHIFQYRYLKPARLPIPPSGHYSQFYNRMNAPNFIGSMQLVNQKPS